MNNLVGGVNIQKTMTNSIEFITVNWTNQSIHILDQFRNVLESGQIFKPDLKIICNGGIVECHKILLAVCSQYFVDLLMNIDANSEPLILLPNISARTFRYIYEYLLKGKVTIPMDQVSTFLKAGNDLKIEGLIGMSSCNAKSKGAIYSETRGISIDVASTPLDLQFKQNVMSKETDRLIRLSPSGSRQAGPCSITDFHLINEKANFLDNDVEVKNTVPCNSREAVEITLSDVEELVYGNTRNNQELCIIANPNSDSSKNVCTERADQSLLNESEQHNESDVISTVVSGNKVKNSEEVNVRTVSLPSKCIDVATNKVNVSTSTSLGIRGKEMWFDNESSDDSDFQESSKMAAIAKSSQEFSKRTYMIRNRLKVRNKALVKRRSTKKNDEDVDFSPILSSRTVVKKKTRRGRTLYNGKYYTRVQAKKVTINCPDCNKEIRLSTLKTHQQKTCKAKRSVENVNSRDCVFEDCPFMSNGVEEVQKHYETHGNKYYCNVCQMMFMSEENRDLHKQKCEASNLGNIEVDEIEHLESSENRTSPD